MIDNYFITLYTKSINFNDKKLFNIKYIKKYYIKNKKSIDKINYIYIIKL